MKKHLIFATGLTLAFAGLASAQDYTTEQAQKAEQATQEQLDQQAEEEAQARQDDPQTEQTDQTAQQDEAVDDMDEMDEMDQAGQQTARSTTATEDEAARAQGGVGTMGQTQTVSGTHGHSVQHPGRVEGDPPVIDHSRDTMIVTNPPTSTIPIPE